MKSFLVVTITCPDRPGIVERVTDVVVARRSIPRRPRESNFSTPSIQVAATATRNWTTRCWSFAVVGRSWE